jgi:hypothetical protein
MGLRKVTSSLRVKPQDREMCSLQAIMIVADAEMTAAGLHKVCVYNAPATVDRFVADTTQHMGRRGPVRPERIHKFVLAGLFGNALVCAYLLYQQHSQTAGSEENFFKRLEQAQIKRMQQQEQRETR